MFRKKFTKGTRESESEDESDKYESEAGILSEEELLHLACEESPFFLGLWRLLDAELRLAVEPFVLWEQGDFRHFLNALPVMCALIASAHKPR